MTDLDKLIPPSEPAQDILTTVLSAGVSAFPVGGGAVARVIDGAIAARAAERQHAYNVAVVAELNHIAERLDRSLTIADVIRSDEFISALSRTQREAAETASETKRARLARATVQSGPWSDVRASDRAAFLRLVAKYEDLHVWLLAYFADPAAWLDAHGLGYVYREGLSEVGAHVAEALGVGMEGSRSTEDIPYSVGDALDDLITDSTMSLVQLDGVVDDPFAPMITPRGRRFLEYLREDSPDHVEAPRDI
ncbi:hypothetical protein [Microbacterium sp. NPDC056234]|uniref:hypothetical protein n=1 Tax=Microbacterium sp. NPDC056234 TaxID=3345757 RepID=UPI0035D57E79